MNALEPKQLRFVEEYLIDLNATAAAARAGYKYPNKQGPRLLVNVGVRAAIEAGRVGQTNTAWLTREYVLGGLRREAEDRGEGSSAAARVAALKLLGQHQGLFPNKVEIDARGTLRIVKVIVHAAVGDGADAGGGAA